MTATLEAPISAAWLHYAQSPADFARDAFGIHLDPWQAEALDSLPHRGRVAVRSGHGVGKTTDLSIAVIHGVLVCGSVVPCTAPTQQQLRSILWPEVARLCNTNEMISRELELTDQRIRLRRDPTIFAEARVARTREGLAGFHHPRLRFIIDEAPGVPEELMQVVEGALTTEGAECFMAGNPTKPTGYFVDAFGKNQDRWHTITVNAEDCARVSRTWLEDMEATWGRDSDVYRVRVLGLPPQGEELGFIAHRLVQAAIDRFDEIPPDGPLILGVDPARYGQDKTAIVARRGFRIIDIRTRHGLSNPQAAAWAADVAQELADQGEAPTIRVDDAGLGGGVTDLLYGMVDQGTLSATIEPMNFGGKGDRYYATNTGVWWGALRKLMQEDALALPDDPELAQQLTTRTFATNLAGKIVLESKDHMRDRGVPSPDKADALAMAFAFDDWDAAYGLRACGNCGHKFIDPDSERACPQCGAKP